MKKYLLTIEFIYSDAPEGDYDYDSRNKKVTVGIYEDFESACVGGNDLMLGLESRFKLHKFPSGSLAKRERFSKNGGCFGSKKDLISNMAYLQTPFTFYAKISTLAYLPIEETINEAIESQKRYTNYLINK